MSAASPFIGGPNRYGEARCAPIPLASFSRLAFRKVEVELQHSRNVYQNRLTDFLLIRIEIFDSPVCPVLLGFEPLNHKFGDVLAARFLMKIREDQFLKLRSFLCMSLHGRSPSG
ncbi:hypothetical protein CN160_07280 [Sinorhizobium meliloti]|nr:hypothetical protein [Sinorhizobium meliloti]RVK53051.1 hypothetical protein CN160_07280 [Sinorhizobium meliloti]